MSEQETARLSDDMEAEMRDLLGSGCVPDYYRQMASGFIGIAERYAEARVRQAKAEGRVEGIRAALHDPDAATAEVEPNLAAGWAAREAEVKR